MTTVIDWEADRPSNQRRGRLWYPVSYPAYEWGWRILCTVTYNIHNFKKLWSTIPEDAEVMIFLCISLSLPFSSLSLSLSLSLSRSLSGSLSLSFFLSASVCKRDKDIVGKREVHRERERDIERECMEIERASKGGGNGEKIRGDTFRMAVPPHGRGPKWTDSLETSCKCNSVSLCGN